ncbi:hypothetical protein HDE76_001561 [Rhodanobacter sp. ANJX3]|uniref:DUF1684 domain-containing protein n=1 Tax=Rhodanobacter sp. ANJX3 TaxID=2723083 RepID=UPI0016080A35|nr:DUF1684 domain-containing protein [Rhodanobacter sp. ANJX3]MBB5358355.1 hypothetical protein [Rhodanobacter sp. ANJX3]
MFRHAFLALALFSGAALVHADSPTASSSSPTDPAAYTQQIKQLRDARVARLTSPNGWLSLIGLEWLKVGANRVGAAADNDIVLKAGPAHLGTVTLDKDGSLHIALAKDSGATIDGKTVADAVLIDDAHATGTTNPTMVTFGHANFYVIDRDGRKALRVKDSDAQTRTHFLGLDYFPIDPSWRITADWVPFNPAHKMEIGSVIGTIDKVDVPGKAVFKRDGHTYELMPYQEEPDGDLFFVIADRTSGKETYGAARFMDVPLPKDGKVILDFNLAYNPPCAFTPYATCPLAPPENRLDLRVTAGEEKYRGGHPH